MDSEIIRQLAKSGLLPQEEMLEVKTRDSKLFIGIPKETGFQEKRVPLVPESVGLLVNNGHRVIIESKAGEKAGFSDNDYSESGAEIIFDTKEIYQANLVMKVSPPTVGEIEMFDALKKQLLISSLQLKIQPRDFVHKLAKKRVTAIAYDYIQDQDGVYPIIRSMGEIAGTTSMLIAAEYLSNTNDGQGIMLGGIAGVKSVEVVIIGAGGVGESAARAALGLGATVKVFDDEIYKLRRLVNAVGQRIFTSIIQPKLLAKSLKHADVVIGALRPKDGSAPCVVTDEMVSAMKFGSVIVDVSIDNGGCFETSEVTNHDNPTFKKYGVIHYCVPNIASRVSKTASYALSNAFTPMLLEMGRVGGIEKMCRTNLGVRHGIYIYNGCVTNRVLAESFDMPYKDIDLLMAAF
jgi:alanine dehydrogenase